MNIRVKTTNVSLSPAISAYVDKRLAKTTKLVGGDPSIMCDIELGKISAHHQKGDIFRAEIHIVGPGLDAYASSEHEDLYAAIDEVRDEIMRDLRAKKGKRLSYIRRSGARVKDMVKGLMPWGEEGWYKRR